jgi:hypothetical protein
VALSIRAIESLAPDQSSLVAATKIKRSAWTTLGEDSARGLIWGECQGSGSTPYRVSAALEDLASKCGCPSRKFPCKHALGLMLLKVNQSGSFGAGTAPDWVNDWMARRRNKTPAAPDTKEKDGPRPSLARAAAEAAVAKPVDEKAEARAAAQRERLKTEREESILQGLDELDLWIADQLQQGLASFPANAAQKCRLAAQRLVDAKAPGLANRIDSLPSELFSVPEHMRGERLIEILGGLHLLAQAYRRQDKLPEALRHDVRRLVGWTIERQALIDDGSAMRVKAIWIVIAAFSEMQPDKLRRVETWLMAPGADDAPRFAVLIDFVPVGTGQGTSSYAPGESFEAELVFYPSAFPLRALMASRGASQRVEWPAVQRALADALAAYDTIRAGFPWAPAWPVAFQSAQVCMLEDAGLWVSDGNETVPIATRDQEDALALSAARISTIVGLWNGRFFSPLLAVTDLGPWYRS